ncbi:MAG: hypothetical protein J6F30_11155 [Cellulosilyticum sp.]|nr:hypothetical protein [Cellulosilyticum sp.]
MRIIKEIIKENQRLWKIYHLQQDCWIKEITIHYITKENLENIIRNSNIQYAILEVGSPYIDWLYSINHDIHIIIDPRSWYQIERLSWSNEQKWQEEVAISLEKQRKEEIKEIHIFLKEFYRVETLKVAYELYDRWQSVRLICHPIGNQIIDYFQIYEEEVFNYFRYLESIPVLDE